MTVRTIIEWPNIKLAKTAEKVIPTTTETAQLVQDLYDTMVFTFGSGLAATQVGITKSVCIIAKDFVKKNGLQLDKIFNKAIVLVNPEIIPLDKEKFKWKEACLSIPGIEEEVVRFENIQLVYQDLSGNDMSVTLHNQDAGVAQHEVDHLFGMVFLDRLSSKKKRQVRSSILQKKKLLMDKKRKLLKKEKIAAELKRQQEIGPPRRGFRIPTSNPIPKFKKKNKKKGR
jgi:peptide deformylase